MTHISKQALSEEKLNELFGQMDKIIARLNKKSAPAFLNELLGKEEKIMIAKRLAAITLCIEDNSPYRISQLLKISPSTSDHIRLKYKTGKYRSITKFITENKSEYTRILTLLETILQAGLPPRGRGRWKRALHLMTVDKPSRPVRTKLKSYD